MAALSPDEIDTFHDAIEAADVTKVRAMIADNPALATAKGAFDFQAIQLIGYEFSAEIFDLLLQHGADVNAVNDEGIALIHTLNSAAALLQLKKAGVDVNLRDARGRTPLIAQADKEDNALMVKALLALGAERDAADHNGETAYDVARRNEDASLMAILSPES